MTSNALTINTIRRLQNTDADSLISNQSLVADIRNYYRGLLDDIRRLLLTSDGKLDSQKAASFERAGFAVFRYSERWCIRTNKGVISL
jgi:hypothetical protein